MMYEIQVRTRKAPEWRVIYIVPAAGDSAPARFQGKEDAKAALRHLREKEDRVKPFRPPAVRREFRMQRVDAAISDLPYISTEMAMSYL